MRLWLNADHDLPGNSLCVFLDGDLPLVCWGNDHTKIAAMFAEFYTRLIGNQTRGEAPGDGSYMP